MELQDLNWPTVAALDRDTPIVFPVAALEQHGRHLPLFTDSILLGEVIRRVKQKTVARDLIFAPLQWLGNSQHHLDFPGTLTASPRTYLDLIRDLAECFLVHGFRRFVFLNGHGGNTVPLQQALFELRQKYRDRVGLLLAALTYWDSADPTASIPGLEQRQMGHACEWETSMILAVAPHLVAADHTHLAAVSPGQGFAPGHRAWITTDRSGPGHIGHPAAATAEIGERLFDLFAIGVAGFLERVVAWDGKGWDA